jgi:hypothetical protein
MVGEWSQQLGKKDKKQTNKRQHRGRKKKKTLQAQPLEEKER